VWVRASTGGRLAPGGANGRTTGLGAGARAREERPRAGFYGRMRSVRHQGGHDDYSRTRGEVAGWPATCAAPAAYGAPRAVRRPVDLRHLAQPTCHGRNGCASAGTAQ
jgi:hypothetical protein